VVQAHKPTAHGTQGCLDGLGYGMLRMLQCDT